MSEFNKLLDAMYERDRQSDGLLGDDGSAWPKVDGLGAGGEDDYSAFLNLDGHAPLTSTQDTNPTLFASASASTQATPALALLNSTATSLFSSFDSDGTNIPGTDATLLLSDFSPELEMLAGMDMFPQAMAAATSSFTNANVNNVNNVNVGGNQMMSMNAFDSFGMEPAFDYPGTGMFSGMSMFGGIPQGNSTFHNNSTQAGENNNNGSNLMSTEEMEKVFKAAGFDFGKPANSVSQDQLQPGSPSRAASPKEMFAGPPPTPLMEMERSTSFSGEGFGIAPNDLIIPSPTLSKANPTAAAITSSSRAPGTSFFSAEPSPAPSSSAGGGGVGKAPRKKRANGKPYEPTGIRNKVLLGPDAPTQSKNYLAPGSTTKKLIPVGFQKKLKLSAGSVDGMGAEDVDKEIMDEIEEKRRKNCVAARESRKRKQDYLNGLKGKIGEWEQWAMNVEKVLREQGLSVEDLGLPEKPEEMDMEE